MTELKTIEPIIYDDIEQGTDEWLNLRLGRITSTSVGGLFVKGKDQYNLGAGLITECDRVISEIKTGRLELSDFSNSHMENGKELESEAIEVYELNNFCMINIVGFVSLGKYLGDSPDAYVDNDGCLEVKCPCDKVHQSYLRQNKVPSKYINQMYWHMYVGRRKWCDFISYNPNFKGEDKMLTLRLEMTDEILERINSKVSNIINHIEDYL